MLLEISKLDDFQCKIPDQKSYDFLFPKRSSLDFLLW
jgi:hypothetical protein